jgi:hypothetical protein
MGFDMRGVAALAMMTTIATTIASCPALAGDQFSIAGTYVQNAACKGDGSDPAKMLVRISENDVHSSFGVCTFVRKEYEGNLLKAQMSCNGPGGNMLLGDVRFSLRADKNIDFVDQDHTYNVVLHRCPQTSAAQQQPTAASAR